MIPWKIQVLQKNKQQQKQMPRYRAYNHRQIILLPQDNILKAHKTPKGLRKKNNEFGQELCCKFSQRQEVRGNPALNLT